MSQPKQTGRKEEKEWIALSSTFPSIQALNRLEDTHIGEGYLLFGVHQFKC